MSGFWQRLTGSTGDGGAASTGPVEVRLESAVPGEIDSQRVAIGTSSLGPYPLHDGQEWYGLNCNLTFLTEGNEVVVGVGSEVQGKDCAWIAVGFEESDEGTRVLVLRRKDEVDLSAIALPHHEPPVYPGAVMSNLWVQRDQPFVTWVGDLTGTARSDPQQLTRVVESVLSAGARHEIFRVLRVRSNEYIRDRDGEYMPFLHKRWAAQGGVELFGEMHGSLVQSHIAWFDGTGRVVECQVDSLHRILASQEPAPGRLEGHMEPWPTIRVFGATVDQIARAQAGDWEQPVRLRVALHSDIWLPWIFGLAHPVRDFQKMFDNRVLALRHTPRLNALISDIATAVRAAGGTWSIDMDASSIRPEFVTDTGIVLGGPEPAAQFTEEDRNADWD